VTRLEELLANATPGPWIAKTDGMFPVVTKNDSFATVMEFSQYGQDGRPEASANASLVALTPDLARLALDMGEALGKGYWDVTTGAWRCAMCDSRDGHEEGCSHGTLLARLDALGKGRAA
jgi:hypothetical protein